MCDSKVLEQKSLQGLSFTEAGDWLSSCLKSEGLQGIAGGALPYELTEDIVAITGFASATSTEELRCLAGWFSFAHKVLEGFFKENASLSPGPSPVRCWPHHFDIATYVSLEEGHEDVAKGIGVGLSPGDGSYQQPYFYITPWPVPKIDKMPPLEEPGHWHQEGFFGTIGTGERVVALSDILGQVPRFLSKPSTKK